MLFWFGAVFGPVDAVLSVAYAINGQWRDAASRAAMASFFLSLAWIMGERLRRQRASLPSSRDRVTGNHED